MKICGRIVFAALMLALLCVILFSILNSITVERSQGYIYSLEESALIPEVDAILVLGAKVYSNGELSPVLHDRVSYGIELYKRESAPKLLLSGDHGTKNYDEVNAMLSYALEQGLPSADVFIDHAGFSTYESIYRARDVFQIRRVIIVTQDYHLARAVYIARALGLEAYGVSSSPRPYVGKQLFELREFFARPKDFLFVHILKPLPKYLGHPLPITGDGSVTYDK